MKKKITIVENTTVITMNENRDIIENGVVVFEENKIIYVGDNKGKENFINKDNIDDDTLLTYPYYPDNISYYILSYLNHSSNLSNIHS